MTAALSHEGRGKAQSVHQVYMLSLFSTRVLHSGCILVIFFRRMFQAVLFVTRLRRLRRESLRDKNLRAVGGNSPPIPDVISAWVKSGRFKSATFPKCRGVFADCNSKWSGFVRVELFWCPLQVDRFSEYSLDRHVSV
eukprot:5081447-Amphidinium_carterae.1